jgi:hypothetical protein
VNDAGLQSISFVQDGLCKWNGIPAANQNLSLEVLIWLGRSSEWQEVLC